jgi:hypothetical protein
MIIAKIKEEDKFREKKLLNQFKNNNNTINNNNNINNKDNLTSSYSNNNLIDKSSSFSKTNVNLSNEIINLPEVINIESYLDKDKKVSVYCTAVANPHAFWVQISSESNNSLKKFNNDMNQYYLNNTSPELKFVIIT